MSNFTVPKGTYTTLATIMGASYDNTKDYILHVNEITRGLLQINSANTGRGKEYKSFADINIDKAVTIYLRGTADTIDVYIEEKKA